MVDSTMRSRAFFIGVLSLVIALPILVLYWRPVLTSTIRFRAECYYELTGDEKYKERMDRAEATAERMSKHRWTLIFAIWYVFAAMVFIGGD